MKTHMQRRLYGHGVILRAWAFSKVRRQIESSGKMKQNKLQEDTGKRPLVRNCCMDLQPISHTLFSETLGIGY